MKLREVARLNPYGELKWKRLEPQRLGPNVRFTLDDIASAVFEAATKLNVDPPPSRGYGEMSYVRKKVEYAKIKAMRDGGDNWTIRKPHGSNLLQYDIEHTYGILDALSEMAEGAQTSRRRMYSLYRGRGDILDAGITPEVIRKAEEILIKPPEELQD